MNHKTKLDITVMTVLLSLGTFYALSSAWAIPEKTTAEIAPGMFEVVETRKMFEDKIKILHEIWTDALRLCSPRILAPYTTGWWCSDCKSARYEPPPPDHWDACDNGMIPMDNLFGE